jgi:hypothetical protein
VRLGSGEWLEASSLAEAADALDRVIRWFASTILTRGPEAAGTAELRATQPAAAPDAPPPADAPLEPIRRALAQVRLSREECAALEEDPAAAAADCASP